MATTAVGNVPLLDLQAQYESIQGEVEDAVIRVLRSQQYILGPEVKKLEVELAEYCGCRWAVACASGSDALLLALMALGVGPGDEVITTPFTFFATVGSISRLGARPVFVDIDPASFNMDPGALAGALSDRTKVIVPIHLFGQCADMPAITAAIEGRQVRLVEDAAQAIGAAIGGRPAGSFGDVNAFSFYPSKNLGCAGDGGALTTDDDELADNLRALRAHGAKKKYYHDWIGVNSRLDSIQAAILRVKLTRLNQWAEARRQNAARYRALFSDSGLVESGEIAVPGEREGFHHVYNQFVIRAKRRDALRGHLAEQGIGTEIYYPLSLHEQKCFVELGYASGDFPASEAAAREVLAIPVYPEIGEANQRKVVSAIRAFYRSVEN